MDVNQDGRPDIIISAGDANQDGRQDVSMKAVDAGSVSGTVVMLDNNSEHSVHPRLPRREDNMANITARENAVQQAREARFMANRLNNMETVSVPSIIIQPQETERHHVVTESMARQCVEGGEPVRPLPVPSAPDSVFSAAPVVPSSMDDSSSSIQFSDDGSFQLNVNV